MSGLLFFNFCGYWDLNLDSWIFIYHSSSLRHLLNPHTTVSDLLILRNTSMSSASATLLSPSSNCSMSPSHIHIPCLNILDTCTIIFLPFSCLFFQTLVIAIFLSFPKFWPFVLTTMLISQCCWVEIKGGVCLLPHSVHQKVLHYPRIFLHSHSLPLETLIKTIPGSWQLELWSLPLLGWERNRTSMVALGPFSGWLSHDAEHIIN